MEMSIELRQIAQELIDRAVELDPEVKDCGPEINALDQKNHPVDLPRFPKRP
jgi:hypothetical protein